jgi:hypothetical protein
MEDFTVRTVAHVCFYIVALILWWALPWLSAEGKLHSPIQRERVIAHCLWIGFGIIITWIYGRAAMHRVRLVTRLAAPIRLNIERAPTE